MGDVPHPPTPEPTTRENVADLFRLAYERMVAGIRVAVTGEQAGRLRRKVLFLAVAVGILLGLPLVALPALMMLVFTDDLLT